MKRKLSPLTQLKRDSAYILLAGALIILSGTFILASTTVQIGGDIVSKVHTDRKVIALTFDDGPKQPYASKTLEILKKYDVRATFFFIGKEMKNDPVSVKRAIGDGHQIGNHGYTHRSLAFMPFGGIRAELDATDQQIRALGYDGDIQVRPPYGHKLLGLPAVLASQGRPTLMWNIAPDDIPSQSSDDIARFVEKSVRPGSIIVLHTMEDYRSPSRNALERFIPNLKHQGYRFVTVNELLSYR